MPNPIRQRREKLKLRPVELAAAAGISTQHLWNLETGRSSAPGLDVARRLAEALGAKVDDLFPETAAAASAR